MNATFTTPDGTQNSEEVDKRRSSLKKVNKTLIDYLRNYKVTFSRSLDDLWAEQDLDKNGYLDKGEAKQFIGQIVGIIDQERAKNYDKHNFDHLFEQFDVDDNGYLSKGEMSQFIKQAFKNKTTTSSVKN